MKKFSLILLLMMTVSILFIAGCKRDAESITAPSDRVVIDLTNCKSCGKCYDVCPYNAIDYKGDKPVIIETKCQQCYKCVKACPEDAIH